MHVPNNISEAACDRMVELLFCTMPAVDPDELAALLGAVLRIMSAEVRRAVEQERQRVTAPSAN
jgi:hypothetical protein